MLTQTYSILTGHDASTGAATTAIADSAPQFPYFNIQASGYGLDAADSTLNLQGSLDNTSWSTIGSAITLLSPVNYAISSFPSITQVVVDGNATVTVGANVTFYIDGSTGNDGRKTASATDLQTLMTYSSLVGVFAIGETISGSISGATGVVVFKTGTASLRVNAVTGTFGATDVITGGTSGATADVDVVTIVTQITTTGITVEAAAGNAWSGRQFNKQVPIADTIWNYYRVVYAPVSVTVGFVDCIAIGKDYDRK